jgi:hypothetical protein
MYKQKYLKYKQKYLDLKNGGADGIEKTPMELQRVDYDTVKKSSLVNTPQVIKKEKSKDNDLIFKIINDGYMELENFNEEMKSDFEEKSNKNNMIGGSLRLLDIKRKIRETSQDRLLQIQQIILDSIMGEDIDTLETHMVYLMIEFQYNSVRNGGAENFASPLQMAFIEEKPLAFNFILKYNYCFNVLSNNVGSVTILSIRFPLINLNGVLIDGFKPLIFIAIWRQNINMVRLLINEMNIDPCQRLPSRTLTPILSAVYLRNIPILRFLLERVPPININNELNTQIYGTPLLIAIKNNDILMVNILISAGSNIRLRFRFDNIENITYMHIIIILKMNGVVIDNAITNAVHFLGIYHNI